MCPPLRLQVRFPQEGYGWSGSVGDVRWIAEMDGSKLLLLKYLNHAGIVALSVLAVYDPTKAFAVLGKNIPALDCERADNFDKFPCAWIDSL